MRKQLEKYAKRAKKTKLPNDWDTLPMETPKTIYTYTLGEYLFDNYLQERGDVLEFDITGEKRQYFVAKIKIALNKEGEKRKVNLLYRYSSDFRSIFVLRQ